MLKKIIFIGLLCSFFVACGEKVANNTNVNAPTNNTAKTTATTLVNSETTPKPEVKETSNSTNKSTYTSLETAKCKSTNAGDEDSYIGECPGVGGFKLELTEGDLRQTINVIAPNKKKFELNFSQVEPGFSTVGDKAEWRLKGETPIALIVRFNVADVEDSSKNTSYLIVSKISESAACITDVVKPGAKQNEEAQKLADAASEKSCKSF